MSDVAVTKGRSETRTLAPWLFFLTPLVTSVAPRLTWLALPLIAAALIVAALRKGSDWRQLLQPDGALIALIPVALYVFLNAIWAANHVAAFGKAALLSGVILIGFAAIRATAELDRQELCRAALAFTAGAFLGALFLLIEFITQGAMTRMAMNWIPLIKSTNAKHVKISQGQIAGINLSDLNQNVAIATFNLWPGLLALRMTEGGRRRAIVLGVYFLAVAVAAGLSQHQSSQLALIASVPVFLLAYRWPRNAIRGLAALWCLAFVLVLPADFLAYRAGLETAPWLPKSFQARVILWEFTATRVLDHPWLGIGAASTPALKEQNPERPKDFVYPLNTGEHAHDLFLQTWYELGVVGVLLIALAGATLALRMTLLPAEAQPFAAAAFTAFMVIAAFGWSMWQTWLVCAVTLLMIYVQVAARGQGGAVEWQSWAAFVLKSRRR